MWLIKLVDTWKVAHQNYFALWDLLGRGRRVRAWSSFHLHKFLNWLIQHICSKGGVKGGSCGCFQRIHFIRLYLEVTHVHFRSAEVVSRGCNPSCFIALLHTPMFSDIPRSFPNSERKWWVFVVVVVYPNGQPDYRIDKIRSCCCCCCCCVCVCVCVCLGEGGGGGRGFLL